MATLRLGPKGYSYFHENGVILKDLKVTIEQAVGRLRRSLSRDGLCLRRTRAADVPSLGTWHIVDPDMNAIVRANIDLAAELEERRLLRPSERLVIA